MLNVEQRLNDVIAGINGLIWEYDVNLKKYIYISQQSIQVLGYPRNNWIKDSKFHQQIIYIEDRHKVKDNIENTISTGYLCEHEYRITTADDQLVWVDERVTPITDDLGRVVMLRGLMRDVGERKRFENQLAHLASHDGVTGLPNRSFFENGLKHALDHQRRQDGYLAILFLDLDGFKDINNSLGHETGDRLLRTIGNRLIGVIRKGDMAARFGGDEFCVLLEQINDTYLPAKVAERCLEVLGEPVFIDPCEIYPRASIGIAIFPKDGTSAEMLIRSANSAMYAAKDAGKHRYAFYQQEMTLLAKQRLNLENDLRKAVVQNEFELHYQPQVSLRTGKLEGVEALIRWRHPQRGMVPPDEFIPVAEKTGLIVEIGEWVLMAACRQISAWIKASVNVGKVAVNLSGIHFCDQSLLNTLTEILDQTKIQPAHLVIEVTESVMQTTNQSMEIFEHLKARGFKIAIDDFGTGFSCLSSLTRLPIDCLKIDKSFVQNALINSRDATIVATIISMGRTLGFSVIAEGAETLEQIEYLHGIGCDTAQGYYFSKPVPAYQIPTLAAFDYFKLPAS